MTKNYSSEISSPLSSNHEDYLKAIYILESRGEQVTNSVLSEYIGFTPASATNMVKKLAQMDLVIYSPHQAVALSPTGRRVALEILRHHRLLELFLHKTLDIPWDSVHEEAERLEHVISEALEDAIAASLGYPKVDPHGDPIPSKEWRNQPHARSPTLTSRSRSRIQTSACLEPGKGTSCLSGKAGTKPERGNVPARTGPLRRPSTRGSCRRGTRLGYRNGGAAASSPRVSRLSILSGFRHGNVSHLAAGHAMMVSVRTAAMLHGRP